MKKIFFWLGVTAMTYSQAYATENTISFEELTKQCARNIHPHTMQSLVKVESGFNPYAIGVVGGSVKQPSTFEEAVATAKTLEASGKNFSMGLGQINLKNLSYYGLNFESVFDPCKNLGVSAKILSDCYIRSQESDNQIALQKALSCYYSGNFKTGFKQDLKGQPSYVDRIKTASLDKSVQIPAIDATINVAPNLQESKNTTVKARVKNQSTTKPTIVATLSENKRPKARWDAFGDWN